MHLIATPWLSVSPVVVVCQQQQLMWVSFQVKRQAVRLAGRIRKENGVEAGVQSFLRQVPSELTSGLTFRHQAP
jgi:hypothetical protein